MNPLTEQQIQTLVAKDQIRDVIMRYARGVDRLDEELIRSCYHEDSTDDHGHWKGPGQDFASFIVQSLKERSHHTTHSIANVLIEINPNDHNKARSEAFSLAYLRRTDESGNEWLDFFSGRYIDKFESRNDEWRISERVIVHDWSMSTQLDSDSFPLPMDSFIQGARNHSDIVYDW